jgi:hypothetical protein
MLKVKDSPPLLATESQLLAAAVAMGAGKTDELAPEELALVRGNRTRLDSATVDWFVSYTLQGNDPLGDTFCSIRTAESRTARGSGLHARRDCGCDGRMGQTQRCLPGTDR